MKKIITTAVFLVILATPVILKAHPGNTDAYGCHTCRTNCNNWGLSYGEYHCHNNKGVAQPQDPIHSHYDPLGGYITPAPDYAYNPTPSCPLMSYYDSLSGNCQCFSGYVVGTDILGEQTCVSGDSKCAKDYGYGSRYNSLNNSCECRYGYIFSKNKCVSQIQYCSDQLGLMSTYNILTDKCECLASYYFNGISCVYKSTSQYASPTYETCPANSHDSPTDMTKCVCDTGYEINSTKTGCNKIVTGEVLGIEYLSNNPLGLQNGWLIKNKKFVEVFAVDGNMCLHWIVNEKAAEKHFGKTWNKVIKDYDSIPDGYSYCPNLE